MKTRKDGLNLKKREKKEMRDQVENPKKGNLTTKGGSWIENPKGQSRKMKI